MIRAVETSLVRGNGVRAAALLDKLGISQILLRRDPATCRAWRPPLRPTQSPWVRPPRRRDHAAERAVLGVADLYRVRDPGPAVWAARDVFRRHHPPDLDTACRRDRRDRRRCCRGPARRGYRSTPSRGRRGDDGSSSVDFSLRREARYPVGLGLSSIPRSWDVGSGRAPAPRLARSRRSEHRHARW